MKEGVFHKNTSMKGNSFQLYFPFFNTTNIYFFFTYQLNVFINFLKSKLDFFSIETLWSIMLSHILVIALLINIRFFHETFKLKTLNFRKKIKCIYILPILLCFKSRKALLLIRIQKII